MTRRLGVTRRGALGLTSAHQAERRLTRGELMSTSEGVKVQVDLNEMELGGGTP